MKGVSACMKYLLAFDGEIELRNAISRLKDAILALRESKHANAEAYLRKPAQQLDNHSLSERLSKPRR